MKLPATELLKQVTNVLKPGNKLHKLDLSTMDLKLTKLTDLEDSVNSEGWIEKDLTDNLENQQTSEDEDEAIFVPFAGIVLMAVFLKPLFDELGLIEKGAFKSFKHQEKAIHILYFMVKGMENPNEPLTTFFKLLCGMNSNVPVIKKLNLSTIEKEEVNNCLKAAIKHWKVLKNTSPDGLREAFLQREGKLIQQQDNWKLTVEQKTIDILMKELPWSISIIKLPWMPKMIMVEWA
ncbi:MAG: hypothetical protein DWQ02_06730 [Bacteroidetes bacterium]|nr:MAG: hypothetical protein DWQ02_06730 [Bacteroidota bacterium]